MFFVQNIFICNRTLFLTLLGRFAFWLAFYIKHSHLVSESIFFLHLLSSFPLCLSLLVQRCKDCQVCFLLLCDSQWSCMNCLLGSWCRIQLLLNPQSFQMVNSLVFGVFVVNMFLKSKWLFDNNSLLWIPFWESVLLGRPLLINMKVLIRFIRIMFFLLLPPGQRFLTFQRMVKCRDPSKTGITIKFQRGLKWLQIFIRLLLLKLWLNICFIKDLSNIISFLLGNRPIFLPCFQWAIIPFSGNIFRFCKHLLI